jgi:peptide/nickel transport system substrate-binding protein
MLEHYRENSEDGGYNLKLGTFHRTSGVAFLNLTYDDPGWRAMVQDARFRLALSHAIDRFDFIETLYFGLAEPSHLNPNEHSPVLASQILDELGMTERGADGYRLDPEGNPFVIEFECAPDTYDAVPAARLYMYYWQRIGINCTLKIVERDLLQERARTNAHKATVHYEQSPLWYCHDFGWLWWGPLWNQWWATGGDGDAEGEEPPDAYKAFRSKVETIMAVSPDAGRRTVAPEVGQMLYENVWYIVPVANQKRPRVEGRRLGNVTSNEKSLAPAQALAMEQVFFRSESATETDT